MPGFIYHMSCPQCLRTSEIYPAFVNDQPWTGTLRLPTWSRHFGCYGELSLYLDKGHDTDWETLARELSTQHMTVGVPSIVSTQPLAVIVTPTPVCPHCGATADVRFGHLEEYQKDD